ncbi:MAG: YigZ family protein [Clostridia bacterium]|nr:YigZ family protein [Clostridia bacterium]
MENLGGTAGSPILKVVLGLNLSNVLVVVTRYFGGVLLGTGGLVKAYTEATQKAIEQTVLKSQTRGYEVSVLAEYGELEKIKYYLNKKNLNISKINYLDNIEIIVEIPEEELEIFTNINNNTSFKIIKYNILKEKFIDI